MACALLRAGRSRGRQPDSVGQGDAGSRIYKLSRQEAIQIKVFYKEVKFATDSHVRKVGSREHERKSAPLAVPACCPLKSTRFGPTRMEYVCSGDRACLADVC